MINVGPFTLAPGIHFGRQHLFVTHRETGKQWVSKSPAADKKEMKSALQTYADFIKTGTISFDPKSLINSCDTRFWTPVRQPEPTPQSEFDALVFVGD